MAAIYQWSPALAVGHDMIDTQHQELYRRLGALVAAMAKGDRTEIGRLLDFLGSYVVEHFDEEEQLMKTTAYPQRPSHEAAHKAFVRDYQELKKLFAAHGPNAAVTLKVKAWIGEWLQGHICKTDLALAAHLRSKAA